MITQDYEIIRCHLLYLETIHYVLRIIETTMEITMKSALSFIRGVCPLPVAPQNDGTKLINSFHNNLLPSVDYSFLCECAVCMKQMQSRPVRLRVISAQHSDRLAGAGVLIHSESLSFQRHICDDNIYISGCQ